MSAKTAFSEAVWQLAAQRAISNIYDGLSGSDGPASQRVNRSLSGKKGKLLAVSNALK